MLKVKRSSWHYRLWKTTHGFNPNAEPKNLCKYFWWSVFSIIIPAVVCSFALAGLVTLLYIMYSNPVVTGMVVGTIVLCAGLGVGTVVVANAEKTRRAALPPKVKSERPRKVRTKPRKIRLLRDYLAARKQKVCPLIEVID